MKGLLALATLMLLSGCASMKASEPAAPWTHWVCDSKAEIFWKYADAAKKEVRSEERRVGKECPV